jgi:serine O-acetyltransferase
MLLRRVSYFDLNPLKSLLCIKTEAMPSHILTVGEGCQGKKAYYLITIVSSQIYSSLLYNDIIIMFFRLHDDIKAVFQRDPAARSVWEIIFSYPGLHALFVYRISHCLWQHKLFFLGRFVSHIGRFLTGIEIHPGALIGSCLFIDHGMGVVIGETAEVGDNVTLYHGVTLGGTTWKKGKRHPTIGNNVVIGTGAKILGPITVGDNTRIGANSVVLANVPPNSVVVGVPGKVVFRVEGNRRIPLDKEFMPDPQGRAITSLLARVSELEQRLRVLTDEREAETEKNV